MLRKHVSFVHANEYLEFVFFSALIFESLGLGLSSQKLITGVKEERTKCALNAPEIPGLQAQFPSGFLDICLVFGP